MLKSVDVIADGWLGQGFTSQSTTRIPATEHHGAPQGGLQEHVKKTHTNKKKNRSMIVHPHHLIARHGDFHGFTIGILNSIKQGLKNKKSKFSLAFK